MKKHIQNVYFISNLASAIRNNKLSKSFYADCFIDGHRDRDAYFIQHKKCEEEKSKGTNEN